MAKARRNAKDTGIAQTTCTFAHWFHHSMCSLGSLRLAWPCGVLLEENTTSFYLLSRQQHKASHGFNSNKHIKPQMAVLEHHLALLCESENRRVLNLYSPLPLGCTQPFIRRQMTRTMSVKKSRPPQVAEQRKHQVASEWGCYHKASRKFLCWVAWKVIKLGCFKSLFDTVVWKPLGPPWPMQHLKAHVDQLWIKV